MAIGNCARVALGVSALWIGASGCTNQAPATEATTTAATNPGAAVNPATGASIATPPSAINPSAASSERPEQSQPNGGMPAAQAATARASLTPAASNTAGAQPSAAGAAAPSSATPGANMYLPCDAQQAATSSCATCHGTTLLGGAPMPLLSYADWHKPAVTQPTLQVYQLAQMRLHDQARPMPPGGQIEASARATLDAWLTAGAAGSSSQADAACAMAAQTTIAPASGDGSFGAIEATEGETCYEFAVHQSTTDVHDSTPYDVGDGEHYEQFYYAVPWPAGTVATRYGAKLDNVKVLHHWLLFNTNETDPVGSHRTAPLPTVSNADAQLLAAWAVGGSNYVAPPDVGFELPNPSRKLNMQWHFYNSTGTRQVDHSIVQVCTVPASMRAHVATFSWLGTEDLNGNRFLGGAGMPPHQESTFSGTCNPSRRGMNDTDPINIIIFWPHMHQLGTHMSATIHRADGKSEVVFDKPFDFQSQLHFPVDHKLYKGDTITISCKFNNTTDHGVPFGESSDTEMCYMFTYAWPANTLENGAQSLIGAKNVCF